jgi:two-component system, cell cycle response regulator
MRRLVVGLDERTGSDRIAVLQLVRLGVALTILVVPAITGDLDLGVAVLAVGYALVIGIVELTRRRVAFRAPALLSGTILVDGLVVALAVTLTGGYRSPLLVLVFLDVVAVTLLVSYRTGFKLALWFGLLLLLGHAAAGAELLDAHSSVPDRVAFVSTATFLAFAACTALFSAVNERALRDSRNQLGALVTLGTDLERSPRPEEVLATLARHACANLGFLRIAVLVRGKAAWSGVYDDGQVLMPVEAAEGDSPLAWESTETGQPLLVRSLGDDPLLDAVLPSAGNVYVGALSVDDEPLGVVAAEWGGEGDAEISTLTVRAMSQAVSQTALALRNAELLAEVARLATRDSLTGLANRRLFDESLEREVARAQRLGASLSLVVIDVDHFKQINDSIGHQAGDAVLRQTAAAIVSSTKGFDVAARFGGDEFVLLLPGCAATDALPAAERVCASIVSAVTTANVTVSAGVATLPEQAFDAEALVTAADDALYDAKRGGRDRVVASEARGSARRADASGSLEQAPRQQVQ